MQILKADRNKSITVSILLYHTKSIAVMYTEDNIVMPEAYFVKPSELTFSQLVKEIINSNMDQPNEPGKPLDYYLIYTNMDESDNIFQDGIQKLKEYQLMSPAKEILVTCK